MSNITIVSSDNKSYTVDRKVAAKSVLIKNMISDLAGDDDAGFSVPIPNVRSGILKKVLQWANQHKDDEEEEEEEGKTPTVVITDWDKKFFNVDQETLNEIVLAANYLNIKGLLDMGCKTIANNLRGKSPEEIRRVFNIPEDTHKKSK